MDAIFELIGLFASLFMMLVELVLTLLAMLFQGLVWVFVRCFVPVYDRAVDRLHARHRAARDARSAGPSAPKESAAADEGSAGEVPR